MRKSKLMSAMGAAVASVVLSLSPAIADTVGIAVGSIGSSTQVGASLLSNQPSLGGSSIGYYIPLGNTDGGVYGTTGTGNPCGSSGFGTCSDSGHGGAALTMILRFSPVSITGPSHLTIKFDDLDLSGVNDPTGFFESLQLFQWNGTSAVAITSLITSIGGLVTGNDNTQTLNLDLGTLSTNPLFLELNFAANASFNGTNTEEFLRATVSSVPGPIVGAGLPGLLCACGALLALARQRRKRQGA
jgi:hypothetical protein